MLLGGLPTMKKGSPAQRNNDIPYRKKNILLPACCINFQKYEASFFSPKNIKIDMQLKFWFDVFYLIETTEKTVSIVSIDDLLHVAMHWMSTNTHAR